MRSRASVFACLGVDLKRFRSRPARDVRDPVSGRAIVVTGKGPTMCEAQEQAYQRIDDIVVPNSYYRDDIGERWIENDGDKLLAWGCLGPG